MSMTSKPIAKSAAPSAPSASSPAAARPLSPAPQLVPSIVSTEMAGGDDAALIVRRFRVELTHCPAWECEASSGEEAWAKYKERHGIIRSKHKPAITSLAPIAR